MSASAGVEEAGRVEADRRETAFRLAGVRHAFPDGGPALRDVDVRCEHGRVLGLMGPNGSGKSTLLRVLAGAIDPDRGRVERPAGGGESHRRTAAVFDRSPFADALGGRANVEALLGLRRLRRADARSRAETWLERFGLSDRAEDPVGSYSRGMRRKTDLAAAFASDPELVLLDEPLHGLDASARGTLGRSLEEHARDGGTAVVADHDAAFMEAACHRVIFLRDGEIAAEGGPSELIDAVSAATAIEVELAAGSGGLERLDGRAALRSLCPRGVRPLGRTGEGTLRFTSRRGGEPLPELSRRLLDRGAEIAGVRIRRPDLDDAFHELVGRPLRGER